ncbi:hypothetical protein ACJX0J_039288, partial [Zea mays]
MNIRLNVEMAERDQSSLPELVASGLAPAFSFLIPLGVDIMLNLVIADGKLAILTGTSGEGAGQSDQDDDLLTQINPQQSISLSNKADLRWYGKPSGFIVVLKYNMKWKKQFLSTSIIGEQTLDLKEHCAVEITMP